MLRVVSAGCERDGRVLFDDLSFSLASGQLLQVIGGNGSGKSSLLRVLLGLYTEYSGDVNWTVSEPPLYLGHRLGVKESMTVVENLRWFAALREARVDESQIDDAIRKLGLLGFENLIVENLSEGQRKRVALGQFLMIQNKCWIMDEPFSAIDDDGLSFLMKMLEAQLDSGGSIIISTHQPILIDRTITTLALR